MTINFKIKKLKLIITNEEIPNDAEKWYKSEEYDELLNAYAEAEKNYNLGKIA